LAEQGYSPAGWRVIDPIAISIDPGNIATCGSRGVCVGEDINVRVQVAGSAIAACYLATGRPAVEQDTGFGDASAGPTAFAPSKAANAMGVIEADYDRASARHRGRAVLAAEKVVGRLTTAGL
jgi:hypothetical protein